MRRGLAGSRERAVELITAARVEVGGVAVTKPATGVDSQTPIRVVGDRGPEYASRGGYKLAGALAAFPQITVAGKRCLDAGASTGGFTDVLLRHGAAEVVAVDVGYGQLAWRLRTDPRVRVLDRTNVRGLTPEQISGAAQLTVADLSFISLTTVMPALSACTSEEGDLVPLVKPQFEVGRRALRDGVVHDPELHVAALVAVMQAAAELGWATQGLTRSPLLGPAGNVEFFLWLRRSERADELTVDRAAIEQAAQAGSTNEEPR